MKKSVVFYCVFAGLAAIMYSCKIDSVPPTVTTNEVTFITRTTAFSGGIVADDGGSTVAAKGVCWCTDPDPTLKDNPTFDGSGPGSYKSVLAQLMPNTQYYIRAYATNEAGTGYGELYSFMTNEVSVATVTTAPLTDIKSTSALCGGDITDDGGEGVTSRGVCWSKSPNPTVSDAHTSDNSGTGGYASNIEGLTPNTIYYVRAYSTNSLGTAYGQEIAFKTDWGQSGRFKDRRDNKEYEWVRIGDQIWMAENLAYLPSVSPSSKGSQTNPYYYVYGYQDTIVIEAKATDNFKAFGVLYNWPAAMVSCPDGWHLPSDGEWQALEGAVDSQYGIGDPEWNDYGYRGYDAGANLKAAMGWVGVGNGTDLFGFSGLPGGLRNDSFTFGNSGDQGLWWTATKSYDDGHAWYHGLHYYYPEVVRSGENGPKDNGFSVRCVRNK